MLIRDSLKKQGFSTSISKRSVNVFSLFLFLLFYDWLSLEFVFLYTISFMWWEPELIKRRSEVQKNMSCKRAFHFDQWKTFSKNYRSVRVCLWLVYKFTENCCRLRLFSEFILRVHPTSLQNKYPNLKTTCNMKLIFFLWTKLLENLHFARYLISVTATLNYKYPFMSFNFRSSHQRYSKKKDVLRNFSKFTGKYLCHWSKPANSLKKRLWHGYFPVKFFRNF